MPSQVRSLVRSVFAPPPAGLEDQADGALLTLFLRDRDATAFEVLVRRHGPTVRAVCRGVLRNPADADDAFQATFLVLVKRAEAVRDRAAVGAWLCGVAARVSRKLRDGARASAVLPDDLPEPPAPGLDFDTRAVLEDEVSRLPERYRLAVQACYVAGHTTTEAAARLGWAKGTVLTRLAWARKRLRARLGARGVSLAGGAFGVLLGRPAAVAVSRSVVESITRAALAVVAGEGVAGAASERSVSLSEGVIRAMATNKMRWGGAAVLAAVLVGAGVGRWTAEAHGEPGGQAKNAKKGVTSPLPNDSTPPPRDPLVGEPDRVSPLPPQPERYANPPQDLPKPRTDRIPPTAVPEGAMIPPPHNTPAPSPGKTFVVSRPVGTWVRDVAEGNATVRITVKFEEDRLTIRATETSGRELGETVIDADYSITRDSVVFGVITGVDASRPADADELTDQPFSFRFRVDNGVLTVKDLRMPGVKESTGLAELLAGRYATEGAGDKGPPARPKPIAPRRATAPANIPPTFVPGSPIGPNTSNLQPVPGGPPPTSFPTPSFPVSY